MKEKIAGISVLVNILLAAGKLAAGAMTGSASVLAEGMHSSMDVFSSAISFFGIRASKKPIDEKHPYGYYKFEVLGGLAITIILFITGVGIAYDAYLGFMEPNEIEMGHIAFGVMLVSALANEVMARAKIYYGKKENSISLLSDGIHSKADVYASVAVLAGLALSSYWIYVDSLLALLIGVYIIKESFSLGKEATDSLLDVSGGEEVESKIREIAKRENVVISDLKTLKKGSAITVNLGLTLPSKITVDEATKISTKFREKLMGGISSIIYVAIQIESHDVASSYFKPSFELVKGFGWQRKGRFKEEVKDAKSMGPGGMCKCPKCGYTATHERGTPCSLIKCPKCGIGLVRE